MTLSKFFLLLTIAISSTPVNGREPSSTYRQHDVPTGVPIPGYYAGNLRPQVHFSPPKGFMNDPNGMFIDAEGVYHLYYQCNIQAVVYLCTY